MAMRSGPITVSVINMKGGVGKSTIAALLARFAAYRLELDVLAVDLDPQANLSQAFMRLRYKTFLENKDPSIVEVFNGYQPPSSKNKSPTKLKADSVAYSVGGDRRLQLIPSRFDFSDNLIGSLKPNSKVLAKFLSQNFRKKDLIIIDCAPTESVLTQAAYHASGLVLVPVRPEFFATIGFPLLHESLENFCAKNKGHTIEVCGVVINNAFYDGGNDGGPEKEQAMKEIKNEAKTNKWHVFSRQLPHSRGFPKRMRGDYSYPGNATQFDYFAREFFARVGLG